MPLTFNAGETKTFQLQGESYKPFARHWIGREYKVCSGSGCALCAAGVAAKHDFQIPISIAGIADSWTFGQSVSQQLDTFTQQGYRLLGLVIRVSRDDSTGRTRYKVEPQAQALPAQPPQPQAPIGQVTQAIAQTQPQPVYADAKSIATADRWAKLTQRLLMRKDFLDIVANQVQVMKDEGLWE